MKNLITRLQWMKFRAVRDALWLLGSEAGSWMREPLRGVRVLEEYVAAALTAATIKKEWIIASPCELSGIRIDSGAAGVGAGSSTIDIMVNGVTIWTTNAKATIATASTGDWTVLPPDAGKASLKAGDIVRYDVTAIPATSGHTRTKITIDLVRR